MEKGNKDFFFVRFLGLPNTVKEGFLYQINFRNYPRISGDSFMNQSFFTDTDNELQFLFT